MQKVQKQTRLGVKAVRQGFTLVELIIVIALTAFLATVTMAGLVNSTAEFAFSNTDQQIQDMILQARSLAINGKAQPDYTDFAHADAKCGGTATDGDPCLATPAHYGVDFDVSNSAAETVTLFADLHAKSGCSLTCGIESVFDPGNSSSDYQFGKDIVLDSVTLPAGTQLILPGSDTKEATIFFSPIFADVSFRIISTPAQSDPTALPTGDAPLFKYGILRTSINPPVRRCYEIHKIAGISEPFDPDSNVTSNVCVSY